jgi:hypothetical protein
LPAGIALLIALRVSSQPCTNQLRNRWVLLQILPELIVGYAWENALAHRWGWGEEHASTARPGRRRERERFTACPLVQLLAGIRAGRTLLERAFPGVSDGRIVSLMADGAKETVEELRIHLPVACLDLGDPLLRRAAFAGDFLLALARRNAENPEEMAEGLAVHASPEYFANARGRGTL